MKDTAKKTTRTFASLMFAFLLTSQASLANSTAADPAAVADAFHAALTSGDEAGVRAILAPEVLIFESGGVERSLEEYASHHMHSDMKFLAAIDRELLDRQTLGGGEVAVVTSRSRLSGNYRDSEINLFSTETLVMARSENGWTIRHVHWSSREAK